MLHAGMDVHQKRSSALCILDEQGASKKQIEVRGHPRKALERLRDLSEPFSVCYATACGTAGCTTRCNRRPRGRWSLTPASSA